MSISPTNTSSPASNTEQFSPEASSILPYTEGLSGVNLWLNDITSNVLYGTLGLIAILVLTVRVAQVVNSHIRFLATLNLPSEQQTYWKRGSKLWLKVKRELLLAPLFRKRHNKEIQLSSAINVGTLPSRLHSIFLSFYILSNLLYCCLLDYHGQSRASLLAEARGRTGHLAVMNMLPLFLFSARNNPFVSLLGIPFDTFNLFHRWVGRIVVIQSLAHTFIWGVNNEKARGLERLWSHLCGDPFLIYGFVSTVAMTVILFQSFSVVRHAFYESFLHLHQLLVIAAMAGLIMHCKIDGLPQTTFVYTLIALWAFERFIRLCRIFYRRGTKMEVEALEGGACRVTFDVRGSWTMSPGCHVYAYVPSISLWMSHPFSVAWVESGHDQAKLADTTPVSPVSQTTISSSSKDSSSHKIETSVSHDSDADFKVIPKGNGRTSVSCIVASRTGMTASLNRAVRESRNGKVSLRAFIEGPYGGIENFKSYGTVVLFAGGVGITHQISHVRDIVSAFADGTCSTRRVVLYWSVREVNQLSWIKPWFEELNSLPRRGCEFKILLYVTRSPGLESPSRESVLKKETGASEHVTFGRMQVNDLVRGEFERRVGAMAVGVCGPGGLADDVRCAVRGVMSGNGGGNVDFWEESFTW
ncbi:ferric reductase like transmembrane component-domain-containing protein [Tricladium varicosporioides]|nr:ferric reductase like transmembrane component-domain-containing protein [Hymenoscyphus varicosporioides]